MNIFSFFVRLTHPRKRWGWVGTTAHFTGHVREAMRRGRPRASRTDIPAGFQEYEIVYYAGDTRRTGWYRFYPAPDPEPDEIRGQEIRIRYQRRRPWNFEKN